MRRLAGVALLLLAATLAGAAEQPESQYTRGLDAYHTGKYAEAVSFFDGVLEADGLQTGALYYRGLSEVKLKKYDAAIADLKAAAQREPNLPVASSLGVAYFESGRTQEAKTWLQKAVAQKADEGPANLLLGIIAFEEGDLGQAEAYFGAAEIADADLKPTVAYYRGVIATRQGRTEEARAAFTDAQAAADPLISQAASGYLQSAGEGAVQRAAPPSRKLPARLSVSAMAGFEYDSNLLLQDIPVGATKSDGRFVLGLGGTYYVLNDSRVRLEFDYGFYQSLHFQASDFNLQGHTLHSSLELGSGPVVPGIEGQYAFYLLDTSTYFQEILGTPYVLIDEMGIGQADVYYRFRGRDYLGKPFNPSRDAINHALGIRQMFYLGSADRTVDIGYQFDREDPESSKSGRDFDARGQEVDAGVYWFIPAVAAIELRYGYRNDDYLHGNSRSVPQFVQRPDGTIERRQLQRRDDKHWFAVALTRQLTEHVYARLGYIGQFNDSNIRNSNGDEIFGYDRHIVSATLGVNF